MNFIEKIYFKYNLNIIKYYIIIYIFNWINDYYISYKNNLYTCVLCWLSGGSMPTPWPLVAIVILCALCYIPIVSIPLGPIIAPPITIIQLIH